MYNPMRLTITEPFGSQLFSFDFQLFGTVTVLLGNSGTGKTLFCRAMTHGTAQKWYAKHFHGEVFVFTDASKATCKCFLRDSVPKLSNALIVMDNANNYLTQKDVKPRTTKVACFP